MTLPEWAHWWLTYDHGESGEYVCFYPDKINKDHNLIKLFNGLKEKHADDIKFENGKYVFVGQVEDKKPYLKFVMTEENDKKFFELSLTEDETIKPIRMKNFY